MGFMLSPASTDAVNQAGRYSYGEATGITQTIRNYAASLGLAVLGTTLVSRMRTNVANQMVAELHVPRAQADQAAAGLAQMQNSGSSRGSLGRPGNGAPDLSQIPHFYKAGLRAVDRDHLLRDGRHHGGGRDRGVRRAQGRGRARSCRGGGGRGCA